MSTETTPTPGAAVPPEPTRPPGVEVLAREIATWRRELARLLAEGNAGRYALIKGDEVLRIWDTERDATQAGVERFGLEPICVVRINSRDPERFALWEAQQQRKGNACPS